MKKSTLIVLLTILVVLVLDQSLKIWVKTSMEYRETIPIMGLSWAKLYFVENNGMAFGLTLDWAYGKLTLSLFRILAVFFLCYYISRLISAKASTGFLLSFALILAGALGNIIDSAFYGLIFSASYYNSGLAQMFPPEGGYDVFLHGKVVDMFYFPMVDTTYPSWIPWLGGRSFQFFQPVFNIADVSITSGVLAIIIFHRRFFESIEPEPEVKDGAIMLSKESNATDETQADTLLEQTQEKEIDEEI